MRLSARPEGHEHHSGSAEEHPRQSRPKHASWPGVLIAAWGSYGTGNGQFEGLEDVAVDASGNIYTVDSENNRVQKFDSSGNFLTKWGVLGSNDREFYDPKGIATDSSDNVYVADTDNFRIQKFDSSGNFLTTWGNKGSKPGLFWYPYGVGSDLSGNVYVADSGNDRIQKFGGTVAAPTVSQVSPENGATGVSTSIPNVTATFSEKMDSSTLNDSTIKMRMGKKSVTVGINCDDPCQTATLDPYPSDSSQLLAANKKFKVSITSGAQNLAGTGLAKSYSWTFTTGST